MLLGNRTAQKETTELVVAISETNSTVSFVEK